MKTIYVINPNNSETVTNGFAAALENLCNKSPWPIQCLTLAEGPPAIETQDHIDSVIDPLIKLGSKLQDEAAAFVIACFSDPAVDALRAQIDLPIFGIGESAYKLAAQNNRQFGVISILDASVKRHQIHLEKLNLAQYLTKDLPLNLGVAELSDQRKTMGRMMQVAEDLVHKHKSEAIVLGCAGMADYSSRLEASFGIPFIEPCQAAVAMAIEELQSNNA